MPRVIIVGGGPAGLSAGLFTQKNGLDTTIFDTGDSWVHSAHFFNYPGIGSMDGDAYIAVARRQVESYGVEIREEEVTDVTAESNGFVVSTGDEEFESDYLVLATGADRDLAEALGCEFNDDIVTVDVTMETSVPDAYATGAMVRREEWQAVISAGDGAAAALNILSKEKGEHFHDFDTPADADETFSSMIESG
jgi:thioredoxin reductase